jgi:protein-S-isoprenylcysteine O-methyltransferase Ste14
MLSGVELAFKVILILMYTIFSIIRIRYQVRARKAGMATVISESRKYSLLLGLLICYEVFTLFLFLLFPEALSFAMLPLPLWLQIVGVIIGAASLLLFIWVHRHLGKNFSVNLKVFSEQQMVDTGPYSQVRHPMYTAFYLLHIAAFLLTANWFIGVTWICGLTAIIFLRINREEKMMLQIFGDRYRIYMRRTGRFIPKRIFGFKLGTKYPADK